MDLPGTELNACRRKEDEVIATDEWEYRLVRREELLELTCYLDLGNSATPEPIFFSLCFISTSFVFSDIVISTFVIPHSMSALGTDGASG